MTHGPLHDALHGAAERYEARYVEAGAAPEKGLAARARRRRRATLAATATASVAILGVGAALAIPAISGDTDTLSSADLLPTVDVPLLNYAEDYSYIGGTDRRPPLVTPEVAVCGGAAPTTLLSDEGFSWEVATVGPLEVSTGTYDFAGFSGWVTYSGEDVLPVTVELIAFVLVDDGEVVGFSNDFANAYRSDRGFERMSEGFSVATGGTLWGRGDLCAPDGRVFGDLPVGDYEAYPVLRIVATRQSAAVVWLGERGVLPPGTLPGDGVYEPGSWDCAQLELFRKLVQCDPTSVGVEVQYQADSASVPYDSTVYIRDVDVTLVGEPVSVTIRDRDVDIDVTDFGDSEMYVAPDYPTPTSPDDLVCGGPYGWVPGGSYWETRRVAGFWSEDGPVQIADGTRELQLLPVNGFLDGSVAYPDRVRVWFLGAHQSYVDATSTLYDDGGWAVVGTGYGLVNGGEPVALNRYAGPSLTTVELTEAAPCGLGGDVGGIWFFGLEEITDPARGTLESVDAFGTWDPFAPFPDWIAHN